MTLERKERTTVYAAWMNIGPTSWIVAIAATIKSFYADFLRYQSTDVIACQDTSELLLLAHAFRSRIVRIANSLSNDFNRNSNWHSTDQCRFSRMIQSINMTNKFLFKYFMFTFNSVLVSSSSKLLCENINIWNNKAEDLFQTCYSAQARKI